MIGQGGQDRGRSFNQCRSPRAKVNQQTQDETEGKLFPRNRREGETGNKHHHQGQQRERGRWRGGEQAEMECAERWINGAA